MAVAYSLPSTSGPAPPAVQQAPCDHSRSRPTNHDRAQRALSAARAAVSADLACLGCTVVARRARVVGLATVGVARAGGRLGWMVSARAFPRGSTTWAVDGHRRRPAHGYTPGPPAECLRSPRARAICFLRTDKRTCGRERSETRPGVANLDGWTSHGLPNKPKPIWIRQISLRHYIFGPCLLPLCQSLSVSRDDLKKKKDKDWQVATT